MHRDSRGRTPLQSRGRVAGLHVAWSLVCVGSVVASGLRLLPPTRLPEGTIRVWVTGSETDPLTSARAARVTTLATATLSQPLGHWQEVEGIRAFADGVLRIEYAIAADTANDPQRFFAAREAPLASDHTVGDAAALRAAVAAAQPGSRILLAPGTYPGGFYFAGVRGEAGSPIVIGAADPANPPVIQGGGNGMHFTDPGFLELRDLVFVGATGNGLNLDDGGSFDSPAHDVVLRGLRISDVGPQGNRDGLKLSGVVDFRVEGCTIERWGAGGSGIDMVGCHRGLIVSNLFRHTPAATSGGANGVQTKGGTRDIVVRRNRFEHAGARGVNVGGSTGLEFFRPPLAAGGEHAEAGAIRVEGNTFVGSTAPVAFVGVDGAVVRFNTIYRPERWALRILQETTAPGFVPCRNGEFTDNLIAFRSDEWASGGVNIGANTAPTTFRFARNWWYCLDDPARSRPTLPVPETSGVYSQSPQFRDPVSGDLGLEPGSPARGVGADALEE